MPLACFQCVDAFVQHSPLFFWRAVLSPSVCFQCHETMVVGDRNMPKACPYVMMRPIVADINHRICQRITHSELFLFLPPSIYPLTRVPFFNWCEWIFNGLNWCFFVMGGGFMAGTLVACHRNMLMVCPCAVVNCFLPFALRWWGVGCFWSVGDFFVILEVGRLY